MWRGLVLACVLWCGCITPAGAQQLDTLLYFPDTLGVLTTPTRLLANPLTGRVYGVGREADIVVFDAAALVKSRRFRGMYTQALFCPEPAKVYLISPYEPQFLSVDAQADTALRTISIPADEVTNAVYSPASGKLYATLGLGDMGLAVVDVHTDSVTKWLLPDAYPSGALAWDSTHDRLYVSGDFDATNLLVLDCATDSLVGSVAIPHDRGPRCLTRSRGCAVRGGPGPASTLRQSVFSHVQNG